MLLFRPDKKSRLTFPGLPPGIIPLTPCIAPFTVVGRSDKKYKISRSQYAMTAGYAFTDYKSQGPDHRICHNRHQKATYRFSHRFRSTWRSHEAGGRDTIRLLREFDAKLFQKHPSEMLRSDMRRLEKLNKATKREWLARRQNSMVKVGAEVLSV